MNFDIKEGLMETVISREFQKYAKEHSKEWESLAKEHAVVMLEKIKDILDERIPAEEARTKIMKVIIFHDPLPFDISKKE